MDEQAISCSDAEYLKDIEEVRMGLYSDEDEDDEDDDDDEPKLRIDTSDEDIPDVISKCQVVEDKSDLVNTKARPLKNANPLQSLQKLVQSPFLNSQISVTDGGHPGCNDVSLIPDRSTKRPSNEINRNSAINYDGAPRGSASGRKIAAKKPVNFQAPVSIELVTPTIPSGKLPSSAESIKSSKLNYVVNKLRTSANEVQHLRQLQKLQQCSEESAEFKKFQEFLKMKQFHARCSNNNLEILPAVFNNSAETTKRGVYKTKTPFGECMKDLWDTPLRPIAGESAASRTISKDHLMQFAKKNKLIKANTLGADRYISMEDLPQIAKKSRQHMERTVGLERFLSKEELAHVATFPNRKKSAEPLKLTFAPDFDHVDGWSPKCLPMKYEDEHQEGQQTWFTELEALSQLSTESMLQMMKTNSQELEKTASLMRKSVPNSNPLEAFEQMKKKRQQEWEKREIALMKKSVPKLDTLSELSLNLKKHSLELKQTESSMRKSVRDSGSLAEFMQKVKKCTPEWENGRSSMFKSNLYSEWPEEEVMQKMNSRMLPALTVIPKNVGGDVKRSGCRRSPPPMLPIESIAKFQKQSLVFRLKKLGTDIELEKTAPCTKKLDIPRLSTTPVTSNDKSLPLLKPFTGFDWPSKECLSGPPSLIPIKPRYVPILPNTCIMPSREASVLSKMNSAQPNRKRKNRLNSKSEYTKLAHALVQSAVPLAPKIPAPEPAFEITKDDDSLPQPVEELISRSQQESESELEPSPFEPELSITETEPYSPEQGEMIAETAAPEENHSVDDHNAQSSPENVDETKYFSFENSQAIQIGMLPNGRKMLSCDICSGVYHKMYSLKKHYYRNHINPKFISDKHAAMFKITPASNELIGNPKANSAVYWCSICECLFDDKSELSSHLTDHPPLVESNVKNSRLYVCEVCKIVFTKKRTQVRHTKKCVKVNQAAMVETEIANVETEIANVETEIANVEAEITNVESKELEEVIEDAEKLVSVVEPTKKWKFATTRMCLFCDHSFSDANKRKKHVLQTHHPKRKLQFCVYCKRRAFADLGILLRHICNVHDDVYFGCAKCKVRFKNKKDLGRHNAEAHSQPQFVEVEKTANEDKTSLVTNKHGKNFKCTLCPKVFSNTVEMGRHRKAVHREQRNNVKKVVSAFSVHEEQKYRSTIITTADYETEFYRNVCGNVKYNLENCMEGRIEAKKDESKGEEQVDFVDEKTEKEPAEPLNFQEMYGTDDIDSRFIHNVSRLHLATQLTILRKANLLDKEDHPVKVASSDKSSSIASRLALAEKPDSEEGAKNEDDAAIETAFSGEWIRSRNYICGTCFARFNNFWDMEDHRWIKHPNVYGSYYEFVTEQAPGTNWAMRRSLKNHGYIVNSSPKVQNSSVCSKCQKSFAPLAEFHKHILECGGDATWTSMLCANHTKRNKKWRPFGSKRRRNIARHRGLKRNIPTTPVKIIGPPKNRQKAGDTETIQRMIANLPPKRITRRVITFDDIDSKKNRMNSQTSILTRKRKENLDSKPSTSNGRVQSEKNASAKSAETKPVLNKAPVEAKNNAASKTQSEAKNVPETRAAVAKALTEVKSVPETRAAVAKAQTEKSVPETRAAVAKAQIEKSVPETRAVVAKSQSDVKSMPETRASVAKANETGSEPVPVAVKAQSETRNGDIDVKNKTSQSKKGKLETVPVEEPKDSKSSKSKSVDVTASETGTTEPKTVEGTSMTQTKPVESVTKTQDKPELRSSGAKNSDTKNKPLIIKIHSEKTNVSDGPVTIIRSDKKKKKTGARIVSRPSVENTTNGRRNSVIIEVKTKIKNEPDCVKKEEPKSVSETPSSPVPVEPTLEVEVKPPVEPVKMTEPEEGEIDLETAIEPADEDSPALPDTSVILAAMKETMRQTDAVISSLPVLVSVSKKRKRDDKKNVKDNVEPSSEPIIKKFKESSPKAECFTCKSCKSVIPGKSKNDTCESCFNAAKKPAKRQRAKEQAPIQQVRCRKCDNVGSPLIDGSLFCEKCSRLQETVCLLCKSSYISDTNDKVCGKCILAGSSKMKKRNVEEAVVTSSVTCSAVSESATKSSDSREECSAKVEVGGVETNEQQDKEGTARKRRNSFPVNCKPVTEVVCDTCGKTWKDEENSGSPICRVCRQSYENNASRVPLKSDNFWDGNDEDEASKCANCSVLKTGEVTFEKLCDGCSWKKTERRMSGENRFGDRAASHPEMKNGIGSVQHSYTSTDDLQTREFKEDSATNANHDHKTPMKNVKLVCRVCSGVFDTVSSYKDHCDICKHRNTEKKPLLSFAKRNSRGNIEPTVPDANSASFEILEGVQIKYVEMSKNQMDKIDTNQESSQIPLVVFETDSQPLKKVDNAKMGKKPKRPFSSPEAIMETIEDVIKSVCYGAEPEVVESCEPETAPEMEQPPEIAEICKSPSPITVKTEVEESDKKVVKKPTKKQRKKNPCKFDDPPKLEPEVDLNSHAELNDEMIKDEPLEMEVLQPEVIRKKKIRKGARMKRLIRKQQKVNQVSITTRLRGKMKPETVNIPRRMLRSRVKSQDDEPKTDNPPSIESLSAPVLEAETSTDVVTEPVESTTKSRKRKSEASSKTAAKRPKEDSSNELGFLVTKTGRTFSKTDNQEEKSIHGDEPVVEEPKIVEKSDTVEPTAVTSPERKLRRRSSEQSECNEPELNFSARSKSNSNSPSVTPNRSRRNSVATPVVESSDFTNSFLEDEFPQTSCGNGLEFGDDGLRSENFTSYLHSYPNQETEDASKSNEWDFFDQGSLGSLGVILDEVNELLSRPEVSNIASESAESLREEMMMWQRFRNDINEIEKQEDDDIKQEDEVTTIMDLDQYSSDKAESEKNKTKIKTEPLPECSGIGRNHECDLCERKFSDPKELLKHVNAIHPNEITADKNLKHGKLKPVVRPQNGVKPGKHRCNHCPKILQSKAERIAHMREHLKTFAASKSETGSSMLKSAMADKFESILLDKALSNYFKSPQETQHKNNVSLKILSQINTNKKNNFSYIKSLLHVLRDQNNVTPPAPVETTTTKNLNNSSSETNSDSVEGYPCPMCNIPFQDTSTRNRHLIMVHAPRQSTHKHLNEGSFELKRKDGRNSRALGASYDNCDNGSGIGRDKIFHSYLLNDSVNTVLKKEPEDTPKSSDLFPNDVRKRTPQKPDPVSLPSKPKPSPNANVTKPAEGVKENDRANLKKTKPCRKKMSKKEMNLPAAVVKLKAEQALLQLCNSKFNKVCSQ